MLFESQSSLSAVPCGSYGKACRDRVSVCPRYKAPLLGSYTSLYQAAGEDQQTWLPGWALALSLAHEHVTTSLAWQDFPEIIWSMPPASGPYDSQIYDGEGISFTSS